MTSLVACGVSRGCSFGDASLRKGSGALQEAAAIANGAPSSEKSVEPQPHFLLGRDADFAVYARRAQVGGRRLRLRVPRMQRQVFAGRQEAPLPALRLDLLRTVLQRETAAAQVRLSEAGACPRRQRRCRRVPKPP